jgi:hypothetical protein
MKLREIDYSASQVLKIRAQLGDNISPASDIKRPIHPCGHLMCPKRYAARIKRLVKHENRYINLVNQGFIKYMNQAY